jgi:hypothetical protein
MSAKAPEEVRYEQVIRSLYAPAEGSVKVTSEFLSMFTDDGYFYDVAADPSRRGRRPARAIKTTASKGQTGSALRITILRPVGAHDRILSGRSA